MDLPIILIALTCGSCNGAVAITERFATMEQCETARVAILDNYQEMLYFGRSVFDESLTKCVDLRVAPAK